MAYLSQQQLDRLNFQYLGVNVKISEKASIYNPAKIHLDDNCRIDDFCILSAGEKGIHIGKYVHIAAYSSLIGFELIYLADFSGISTRVSIYSSNDDYSGHFMTNPIIPQKFRNVQNRPVILCKHVIIGTGSVILPGAKLNEGVAIGALSLVLGQEYAKYVIYAGTPAQPIKERKQEISKLAKIFLETFDDQSNSNNSII